MFFRGSSILLAFLLSVFFHGVSSTANGLSPEAERALVDTVRSNQALLENRKAALQDLVAEWSRVALDRSAGLSARQIAFTQLIRQECYFSRLRNMSPASTKIASELHPLLAQASAKVLAGLCPDREFWSTFREASFRLEVVKTVERFLLDAPLAERTDLALAIASSMPAKTLRSHPFLQTNAYFTLIESVETSGNRSAEALAVLLDKKGKRNLPGVVHALNSAAEIGLGYSKMLESLYQQTKTDWRGMQFSLTPDEQEELVHVLRFCVNQKPSTVHSSMVFHLALFCLRNSQEPFSETNIHKILAMINIAPPHFGFFLNALLESHLQSVSSPTDPKLSTHLPQFKGGARRDCILSLLKNIYDGLPELHLPALERID